MQDRLPSLGESLYTVVRDSKNLTDSQNLNDTKQLLKNARKLVSFGNHANVLLKKAEFRARQLAWDDLNETQQDSFFDTALGE